MRLVDDFDKTHSARVSPHRLSYDPFVFRERFLIRPGTEPLRRRAVCEIHVTESLRHYSMSDTPVQSVVWPVVRDSLFERVRVLTPGVPTDGCEVEQLREAPGEIGILPARSQASKQKVGSRFGKLTDSKARPLQGQQFAGVQSVRESIVSRRNLLLSCPGRHWFCS